MPEYLGPSLATRPLHFFWLLDVSRSTADEDKIASLNLAVREALPALAQAEEANPGVDVLVRAVAFASRAWWHIAEPTPVVDVRWQDLQVADEGSAEIGVGIQLVLEQLRALDSERKGMPPALVLVSDGRSSNQRAPTFEEAIDALAIDPWGRKASRTAIAMGPDPDYPMLQRFIGNDEVEPLVARDADALGAHLRWASTIAVEGATRLGPSARRASGDSNP